MNKILIIVGWFLVIGGAFGLGVFFVRVYDKKIERRSDGRKD